MFPFCSIKVKRRLPTGSRFFFVLSPAWIFAKPGGVEVGEKRLLRVVEVSRRT